MFCFGILILHIKKCQLKTLSSRAPEPFPRQSTTSNTKALSCGPAMQTQVLRQRQTRLRNYFSKTPSSSGVEKSRLNFLLIKLTVSIPNFKWRMFIREIIGSSCSSHSKCITRKKSLLLNRTLNFLEIFKRLIQVLTNTTFPWCWNIQLPLPRVILPWLPLISQAETSPLHLRAEPGEPGKGRDTENNWAPLGFAKAEPVPHR